MGKICFSIANVRIVIYVFNLTAFQWSLTAVSSAACVNERTNVWILCSCEFIQATKSGTAARLSRDCCCRTISSSVYKLSQSASLTMSFQLQSEIGCSFIAGQLLMHWRIPTNAWMTFIEPKSKSIYFFRISLLIGKKSKIGIRKER